MTRSLISSGSTFEAEIGYSRAVGWGSKNLTLTQIFSGGSFKIALPSLSYSLGSPV